MMGHSRGSVALITVIVLCGILLVSGITIVLMSADLTLSTENYSARTHLDMSLRTCIEESLQRVKMDVTYTGDISFSWNGDSCSATVDDDPVIPGVKRITVDASFEEYEAQREYGYDVSVEPFEPVD